MLVRLQERPRRPRVPARLRPVVARLRPVVGRLRPSRRAGRLAGMALVALVGAWLGLLIGGTVSHPVGPVDTEMSARLSWTGDTLIDVGPLGTLKLDTHDGPIGVNVAVQQLNVADARLLFENPAALDGLESWIAADAHDAVTELVVRSSLSAAGGAALLALLVYRRRVRRVALTGGTAVLMVVASLGAASATWNPKAVYEPQFTGLLASAPSVVGSARDIVTNFSNYSQGLANLVTNVSQLYDVTSTLPSYQPDPSTVRVLHVADLHLNPAAWDVIESVAEQFRVQAIVDSGDISDHGSDAERRFVNSIADLDRPYVYVQGNHDSASIVNAVRAQPNAVVLDDGQVREVAGLRFIGDGDPRFTPDKSVQVPDVPSVRQRGRVLAAIAAVANPAPDVAVVHDPEQGTALDGEVPLVLAGHTHQRNTYLMDQGTRMFVQGSTGGAGLRALEGEKPTPVQATVLYFDSRTRRLQAWDDITLGGLGLASARISRTVAPEQTKLAQGPDSTPTGRPGLQARGDSTVPTPGPQAPDPAVTGPDDANGTSPSRGVAQREGDLPPGGRTDPVPEPAVAGRNEQ